MKILVKEGGKKLRFWVPNCFFNEKLIRRFADNEVPPEILGQLGEFRHALKSYVKEYGHFTLVEVISGDTHVKISF